MSKKIDKVITNIDYEIGKVEEKIKEFQDYLIENTVITKVKNGELKEASEAQALRHKEIEIQIKMNDAVLRWLPILKSLREEASKKEVALMGDVEMNPMFKRKFDK